MSELYVSSPDSVAPAEVVARIATPGTCPTCVFYSRPEVGARALPHVERVVRNHRRVVEFQFYLWPFDVLDTSPFADRVRASAETAEVVVVATDDDAPLPESLRSWFELWRSGPAGEKNRLLALFHTKSPDRMPVPAAFQDLTDFAITSGVGFIWNVLPAEVREAVSQEQVAAAP